MQQLPIGGWALAKLLPPSVDQRSKDYARSIRRRFAALGLILTLGLVAFLWDETGNLAGCAAGGAVALVGLWFYAEHGHRARTNSESPKDALEDDLV